jgi:hypothetical protein
MHEERQVVRDIVRFPGTRLGFQLFDPLSNTLPPLRSNELGSLTLAVRQ